MARSYTQNLKLILEDNLTTVARANLERIDSLGDAFLITSTENLEIRSANNINIRPNASEIGGTGSGGTINFGNSGHQLTALNAYAALASFTGNISIGGSLKLQSGLYSLGLQAGAMSSNLSLTLPIADGSNGQALVTNGAGQLAFQSIGGGSNPEYSTQWTTADGTIKTVTHNLGTNDFLVFVKENSSNELIHVNEIVTLNLNSIQLTATEPPGAGNWTIYLLGN